MKAPFNNFRLLLRFLRFTGFFPFRKVIDPESLSERLVPIKWTIQLLQYSLITVILNAPSVTFVTYFKLQFNRCSNPIHCYVLLFEEGIGIKTSKMDIINVIILLSLNFVIHFTLMISIIRSKKKIIELHDYIADFATHDPFVLLKKKREARNRVYFLLLLFVTIISIFSIASFVGFHTSELKFQVWQSLWSSIVVFTQFIWMLSPFLTFYLISTEIASVSLPSWLMEIKKSIINENEISFDVTKKFMNALQMFCEIIKVDIFILFTIILLAVVLNVYLMVSFFVGDHEMNSGMIVRVVAFGIYGIFFMIIAFDYNYNSQLIYDSTQELKDLIEAIDTPDNTTLITFNSKEMRPLHAQKLLIKEIDNFKGFNGNGYFTLGKPLLTSILANFITYLIILVQFRISEKSN